MKKYLYQQNLNYEFCIIYNSPFIFSIYDFVKKHLYLYNLKYFDQHSVTLFDIKLLFKNLNIISKNFQYFHWMKIFLILNFLFNICGVSTINHIMSRVELYDKERLTLLINNVKNLHTKRDFFNEMKEYYLGPQVPFICGLYGVRRTGKTTAMLQLINEMNYNEMQQSLFVTIPKQNNEKDLLTCRELFILIKSYFFEKGYKNFFLDEITNTLNFYNSINLFADSLALCGAKIFITGTDSLVIKDSAGRGLLGRIKMINTTFMSYAEWIRLNPKSLIDDFAKNGSILGNAKQIQDILEEDEENSSQYILSAYAENLENSFKQKNFFNVPIEIKQLADTGRLQGAIQRIIENTNLLVIAKVLRKNLNLSVIGSLRQLVNNIQKNLENLDEQKKL